MVACLRVWADSPFGVAPDGLRLLMLSPSKQAQLAAGPGLLCGHYKGGKVQPPQNPVLGKLFLQNCPDLPLQLCAWPE